MLEGVRILDLSRLLPGPYCSLLLADLGADVVKVEAPIGGDYLRWMPPVVGRHSALFHALNRNKRSMALDLKQPEGKQLFLRLVESGWDVVLESFRPGVMDRLGLGWEALRERNPGTILCSVSGYGQDGPLRERAGHDLNYVGRAGVLGFTGTPDGGPVIPGVQVGDVGGGSYPAAVGILAALVRRAATGEGAFVDISMTDGALGFMTMHLVASLAGGEALARGASTLSGGIPCYNVYRAKDGKWLSLGALEPHFWQRFCAAIGRDDLAGEGLATGDAGARVRAEVQRVFDTRTRDEWVAALAEHDCCCEPVNEGEEIVSDPQLVAREMFLEVEDPEDGRLTAVATPVKVHGRQSRPPSPAPALGEHTDEVLGSAGVDAAELERLRSGGVIA